MVATKLINAIRGAQPNVTFMVANQNSPVPEHVFCEVYAIGTRFAGMPEYENDEFEETVSVVNLYKVSLTYNGLVTSDAERASIHMSRFLQSSLAANKLTEQGLSLISIQDIQHAPKLKDVDIYMNYTLDIVIASSESDSFAVDVVDVVRVVGDFEIDEHTFEVEI